MDTQRLILLVIFTLSLFFLYQAWQRQYAPQMVQPTAKEGQETKTTQTPTPPSDVPAPPPSAVATPPGTKPGVMRGERITVKTDLLRAEINTLGGVIERVEFLEHGGTLDKNRPYAFLQNDANRVYIAQSGFMDGLGLPNHTTLYELEPGVRELVPGNDRLELKLRTQTAEGITVVQTLAFRRGSYVIDISYELINTSNNALPTTPYLYFQLQRDNKAPEGQSSMLPTYTGIALYNEQDKYKKIEFSDIDKNKTSYTASSDNGWIGMQEHYFVAAWLPPDKLGRNFYTKKSALSQPGPLYIAGLGIALGEVKAQSSAKLTVPIYIGPQEQDKIAQIAKGLEYTVDYGIFTVLAAPLFWLLHWIYKLLHNWGWAIVALTVLIKLVFYPLNAASARSMAKLKVVGPKFKALQEQYANDKARLQQEMMELYRKEKINPLGGCLPILVQIPVFIALYWVLLSAVELRQAPWLGWIQDLASPDPYFILPIVYAITAYLQVKLTPSAPMMDPMQQKVMQIMPVAFSVMFIFFPSGLVLYWLVNNILTIGQQWHMNRMLEKEAAVAAAKRR